MALPYLGNAISIKNEDSEVQLIRGRVTGKNWVYVKVNPNGATTFNCGYGCELVLGKTGLAVQLETDADVASKDGVLEIQ